MRTNGGEPTLMCTSDAPALDGVAQQLIKIQHGRTSFRADGSASRVGDRLGYPLRSARRSRSRRRNRRRRRPTRLGDRSAGAISPAACRVPGRVRPPCGPGRSAVAGSTRRGPAAAGSRRSRRSSRAGRRGRSRPRGTPRAGRGGRQRHDPGGEIGVVAGREPEAGERVGAVGVEAGRDEHPGRARSARRAARRRCRCASR